MDGFAVWVLVGSRERVWRELRLPLGERVEGSAADSSGVAFDRKSLDGRSKTQSRSCDDPLPQLVHYSPTHLGQDRLTGYTGLTTPEREFPLTSFIDLRLPQEDPF